MAKDLHAAPPAIVAIARELAAGHPGASLPCPVCAKEVRGEALARHLADHGALASATGSAAPAWTGADRWIRRPAILPLVLWFAGLAALVGLLVNGYDPGAGWFFALIGWFFVAIAALVLASVDVLQARLTLDGEMLRLRHGLGLRTVEIRLPAALAVGRLRGPAKWDTSDNPVDADVGSYLQLTGDGREIVVGCTDGPALARHWDPRGWQRGGPRKRWSVTLAPAAFVGLAYALAGRKLLALRAG